MQAYEFNSVIEDDGIIHIPKEYLQNISSPVKVILLTNIEPRNNKKHFSAMKLKYFSMSFCMM
jgi:hypothetical protein